MKKKHRTADTTGNQQAETSDWNTVKNNRYVRMSYNDKKT